MKHGYFHFVLLNCVKHLNGERSLSAIYHLLKGKKSSQTIQDGKLFNLSHMFGLFPRLSRQQVNDACEQLLNDDFIVLLTSQHYVLTEKGHFILAENQKDKPIPSTLNGWEYGDIARLFWRRLSLLVQVLSNSVYERHHYLPLTKNQEDLQWVKRFLRENTKSDLINLLYEELKNMLLLQSNKEATIFIQRLTSSQRVGLTFDQIALKQKDDPIYIYLQFWNIVHSIIQHQQVNGNKYIVLKEIIKDRQQKNMLTASTAITRSYLLQGISLSEIAVIRRLKESTIEDHIVEITLHDNTYTPDPYLSKADFNRITAAIEILKTHQLKKVKEYLNHQFSYFQIRLVFAINGRNE